jgi:hypothetical protein
MRPGRGVFNARGGEVSVNGAGAATMMMLLDGCWLGNASLWHVTDAERERCAYLTYITSDPPLTNRAGEVQRQRPKWEVWAV